MSSLSPIKNVFLLGLGYSASRIALRLQREGYEVYGLNRSGTGPAGLRILKGDASSREGLSAITELPPLDLMISSLSGSRRLGLDAYRDLVTQGPLRALDRLSWQGPRRVLYLGSTGVYGQRDGEWIDEMSPTEPLHDTGRIQLEAEAALREAADALCVLRLSGLYGPGRTRLIRQALRKRPYFKGDLWANNIHVEDVAGIVSQLLEKRVFPETLLASDDRPMLRREIFDWVRSQHQAPEGLFDENHPESAMDRGNKRISNRRLRGLGLEFRYPDVLQGLAAEMEGP